ncbi:hypothetical protein C8A01DRAFT_32794 [Parachaetomium inaequale]|uniref:Uncharacterized protein n=1 Tax=Parachaetomium inaequale TaxID=2588326 RepID=A0AAN6PLU8_9PEZI|nr:hypothetical protein C8A01DRAFT_32794 [Parachaetomium inaequale]
MGIERAPQLDIDNPNAVDAHPVFFTPVPDTPDFRRAIAEQLREYCQGWGDDQPWDHCPDELQHIDRLSCACRVIDMLGYWGHHAISTHDLHPADIPKWRKAFAGTGAKLPSYTGSSVYLKKHGDRPPQPLLEWFTPSALYISNKTKGMRHWVGYVADNTSHKKHLDEALRSEITSAISFIRRRIQATRDTHSTIPVLVISFYHNDTVRITQVCWNGEHNPITFRQSRLVDIASDSFDTPDIFLLMRWMQCLPLREPKARPPNNARPERGREQCRCTSRRACCKDCHCPSQTSNADADVDADTEKSRHHQWQQQQHQQPSPLSNPHPDAKSLPK